MATTDTEVDLVVNEMTQEQLDELDAAGTVPPNQMFFTEGDIDADAILSLPVGSIFASAIPLTDSAFHLLDGSIISQTGIYEDFSNLLKSLVSAGYAITCTLAQYETDVANTGNCGKFVIDNTAGTIKLPTITRFVEGLSNLTDIGKSLQAGLPNITGTFRLQGDSSNAGIDAPATGSGSVTPVNDSGSGSNVDGTNWTCGLGFDFNASKSSAVYGRSSEVQPNATRYPYYIVLANSYKSKVALDVDNILQEVYSGFLQLSGGKQTITDIKGFVNGKGLVDEDNYNVIQVDKSKQTLVGSTTRPLRLYGSATRPTYEAPSGSNSLASVSDLNTFSMLPRTIGWGDWTDAEPTTGQVLFTAPSNGVAYVRFQCTRNGNVSLHLRNENNIDIAWQDQWLDKSYGSKYAGVFVMKEGFKIYCYENNTGYSWGGVAFVASATI